MEQFRREGWYLTVPALAWVAGFMLVDRMRHKRQSPAPGEALRQRVELSLTQVEHQIWLLRNIIWWYILPFVFSIIAFFSQVAWQARSGGWVTALVMAQVVAVTVIVMAGVYWLNHIAVRSDLEPRRQELETRLGSLEDERPAAGP